MTAIGIDAGGTLTKMAIREDGNIHYKTFPTADLQTTFALMQSTLQSARISVTGGKAHQVLSIVDEQTATVPEFSATSRGVRYLLQEQPQIPDHHFILTNVGTGTSIHYMNGDEQKRLMGSGVGGGALLGLSDRLAGVTDFEELTHLWTEGERSEVDLQVKDIYGERTSPILSRLTASNFGKPSAFTKETKADQLAAVVGMVAETVMLFSIQACQAYDTSDVVYIGSIFSHHEAFRDKIASFTSTFGMTPYFLEHGEMSGALGALLALDE